jgi:uncharacterized membrane protein
MRPSVVVVAITILAAALRAFHLDYKSFWLDEALCYCVSQGSFEEILNNNKGTRATPPLFTLITSLVLPFGNSEALLRAIPALAGVAAVSAVYWLARQWLSRPAAYLSALLVALAQSQIALSQQLREYSMAMLCAVLILGFYFRCLRDPTWRNWIVLSLLWLLGLSLQYGLAVLIGAMNIVFLIEALRSPLRRRLLSRWALANLPVVALAIVAFGRLDIDQLLRSGGPGRSDYLQAAYWDGSFWSLGRLAVSNTLAIFDYAYPTATLLLLLVGAGIMSAWQDERGRVAVLALLVPTACTFLAACLGIHPYSGGRHSIFLTPMIYVLTGFGAAFLANMTKSRGVTILVLVIVVLIGVKSALGYLNRRGPQHMRPIVRTLSSSIRQGDRLYVHYKARPAFRYYYRSDPRWRYYHENVGKWIYCFTDYSQPEKDLRELDAVLAAPGRVWMVFIKFLTHREMITSRVAEKRKVELVAEDADVWLYLVH